MEQCELCHEPTPATVTVECVFDGFTGSHNHLCDDHFDWMWGRLTCPFWGDEPHEHTVTRLTDEEVG